MYKVDRAAAAAAAFHLVLHSAGGLHIFDHGQLLILWLEWEPTFEPHYNRIRVVLKRVIASFQCSNFIIASGSHSVFTKRNIKQKCLVVNVRWCYITSR